MELSIRLEKIASMVEICEKVADIGTDHAYIPIYLIENGICKRAVASDINKGPVEKAKKNILLNGLEDEIECRLGGGLSTLKPGEVNCAIIAGMGGNLIRDIIQQDEIVFEKLDYCILQPVQNPEVLRKFIYKMGYTIIDEELCFEEGKYYEILKIKYGEKNISIDPIYYEIGKKLIDKKQPLINSYINYKLDRYNKVYENIIDDTENAKLRKDELRNKICKLRELLEQ